MNFPHTATIRRTTKAGTKYTYGDAGTVKCFLQPMDAESAQQYGITFTKGSKVFLPFTSDVKEGDRLVVNGTEFGVKGVKRYDFGNLMHMYAVLEEVS